MRIAVACGGTGGHIFPGLAVASLLRERGHEVTLWLSGRDVESGSVAGWPGKTVSIRSQGFGGGLLRAVGAVACLFRAWGAGRRAMRADRPDILLAMGSYTSVAPVLAARSLRVPVVLHEANVVPGRAISALARFARVVAVSSQETCGYFANVETAVTGFPVRADLDGVFEPGVLEPDRFTLLVMGGSQGAHRLNEIASDAVCLLHKRGGRLQVVHLTGAADEADVRLTYAQAGVSAVVYGFLAEMGRAYQAADLAIARAGAASCAELAACAVPTLFVPLPVAPRDHQARNAEVFVRAGAGDMRRQAALTAADLVAYIEKAMAAPERLTRMMAAMRALAAPDATARLANLVEETA